MSKALFESAFDMFTERLTWENSMRAYTTMRLDGLPRLSPPFKGAADTHVPVIDNAIRKRKPYLLGQMQAGDRLVNFKAMQIQAESMSDAAADYYDFYTRNYTDFLDEMDTVVDTSCLRGRGVLKCTIDPLDDYKLIDESIDPLFILMPQNADDFEDADEFVHVRLFTVASYKRLDDRWKKDPDTINKIKGQPLANLSVYLAQKKLQEGITNTTDPNQIIVWEHYTKTMGGWTINWYSPSSPDVELRKPTGVPYKWNGKPICPFVSFPNELKDKGWYSPRGLARLLAPEEQLQTKVLNEQLDCLTFYNRPVLTGDGEIPNTANLRWRPGEYVQGLNVRPLMQSGPPMSFDEIGFHSAQRAEEISQAPDNGLTNSTNDSGGKPRTAAENNRIAANANVNTNYNGEMFRRRLAKTHTLRWAIICQFKERIKSFVYWADTQLQTLPQDALHNAYVLVPDGSIDGWNPQLRQQKYLALLQSTAGSPNVNPEPITKKYLNAVDTTLAQQAFVPTGLAEQAEGEAQAMEILLLTSNPPYPAKPLPSQNQVIRIQTNLNWIMAADELGKPVEPMALQRIQQNIAERYQILQQQQPKAAAQVKKLIMQMEQVMMQRAASKSAPSNVAQLPPQQPPEQQTGMA